MRVVQVHNYYQQPGGEDQVFAAESALLEANGHSVTRHTAHNDEVAKLSDMALAKATVWNTQEYKRARALFAEVKPEIVHVHNTLPLISPSVYYAAKAEGAAVVQTLHNYRFSCLNGLFYRDGRICEDCLGKSFALPGIVHACYRGSRAASSVVATMLAYHKIRGSYHHKVDQYIALTEFSKQKFIEMGLPEEKLGVKPNFVAPDPGVGAGDGGYALYVGRLSEEKGLRILIDAWQQTGNKLPLKVVGGGNLEANMTRASNRNVSHMGYLPRDGVLELLQGAALLVFPSLWYEGFPMTIAESFACGTPVVASQVGNAASIVEHGRTGLHFRPGHPDDLATQVMWLLNNPDQLSRMRGEARAEYEKKYTADLNYRMLIENYERALHAN